MAREAATERRRQILDAAVRVFARQGFHSTRVADIADEADVAYGLVYHYFSSKENVLDELFRQRWSLLNEAIEAADKSSMTPQEKLTAVAAFIFDSYRYDPDLMKVIIVEVTRAANTFARTHMDQIGESYQRITKIVADGQKAGILRTDVDAYFASMTFYGAIEQVLTSWIFALIPVEDSDYDDAAGLVVKTICEGLEKR